jgi:NADH-quinone oxidoreductase subunit N
LLEFKYFFSYSTAFALLFVIIFFSFAGIPPLAGFFIKFLLFKYIFISDFLVTSTFFIILILSAVSAFYYIRCISYTVFVSNRIPFLFIRLPFFTSFIFVNSSFILILFLFFQPSLYLLLEFCTMRSFFF